MTADGEDGDADDADADAADDADAVPVAVPIEPTLDLHPFAPRDIVSVVDEYVAAAHAAGLPEVRLIHGRGSGVQRGRVQAALERHPLVIEFWDAPETHLGATIARLRAR
jgi:DNA-nicking Smr family endonuclease